MVHRRQEKDSVFTNKEIEMPLKKNLFTHVGGYVCNGDIQMFSVSLPYSNTDTAGK